MLAFAKMVRNQADAAFIGFWKVLHRQTGEAEPLVEITGVFYGEEFAERVGPKVFGGAGDIEFARAVKARSWC